MDRSVRSRCSAERLQNSLTTDERGRVRLPDLSIVRARIAFSQARSPPDRWKGTAAVLRGNIAHTKRLYAIGTVLVFPISASDLNRRPLQTKAAVDAGVLIGFVADSAQQARVTASMLVSAGVPAEEVLSGLTEGGAALVGMKNVGLEPGANADFRRKLWSL